MFVRGALGKAGRKRARRAERFLGGQGGFLTASTVMAAIGVAWGLYDSLNQPAAAAGGAPSWPGAAPPPATPLVVPPSVARLVRLATSAATADGTLSDSERDAIMAAARAAGVAPPTDDQLRTRQPLAEIVGGVTTDQERRDLYVLAFTIVRADEGISGAERIYLAQLAAHLGLEPSATTRIEQETARDIDAQADAD